jgi:hypothetical protein
MDHSFIDNVLGYLETEVENTFSFAQTYIQQSAGRKVGQNLLTLNNFFKNSLNNRPAELTSNF